MTSPGKTLADGPSTIRTQRILLRPWQPTDLDSFAQLNADARVMEFFPSLLTQAESDALAERIQLHFQHKGFGLWAVEIPRVTHFAGFIGLAVPSFETHFTPCVEVGWRLAAEFWGSGYASEGAAAVLQYGWNSVGLKEIVSFTSTINIRSRRVMERIGMVHSPDDDFLHPLLPTDHRLAKHVLYRAKKRPN